MRSASPVLTSWRRIPGPPRDHVKARLLRLYRRLADHFGPQRWWPARTPFEVAVGAVLTQNTAWTGAARAIAGLRREGLLTPAALAAASHDDVARLVRPAGTYRVKARHLQVFTRWLIERFGGRFAGMRREPLGPIRREVLRVPGLGPETADAILLYAANRPVFVADAYTRRVLARHGFLDARAGYEDARAFIEEHLPSDPVLFNEYHALLVAVAKSHCRTVAHCETCPLRFDLDRPRSLIARRTPGSASPAVPPRRERRGSARARPSL